MPAARVVVGRAEEHGDLPASGDGGAADGDVAVGGAEEGLHRGLPAHRLVEVDPDQAGPLAQAPPLGRVGGEGVQGGGRAALPLATTVRLVDELTRHGLPARDEQRRVRIGTRMWEPAQRASPVRTLRETAMQFMGDLHHVVGPSLRARPGGRARGGRARPGGARRRARLGPDPRRCSSPAWPLSGPSARGRDGSTPIRSRMADAARDCRCDDLSSRP
ncbi:hypothetical protein GCM10023334_038380 [Nonomuraea thailandensis]